MRRDQPNPALQTLLAEAGWSPESLATRLNTHARQQGLTIQIHHKSPYSWLYNGTQPRKPWRGFITAVLTQQLRRHITPEHLGWTNETPHQPADAGLHHCDKPALITILSELGDPLMLHRRTIIAATPAALTLAANDWANASSRNPTPTQYHNTSAATLDHIDESISNLMKLDDAAGGQFCYPMACAELRSVLHLLQNGGHSSATEIRLYRSASGLARLAAWSAGDLGNHALAERYALAALRAAQHGQMPQLGTNCVRTLSEQRAFAGRYDDALALLRSAEIGGADTLTNVEKAGLHSTALRFYGRSRNERGVAESTDSTFEYLALAEKEDGPPWTYWVNLAELKGWTGEAKYHTGDLQNAEEDLRYAIEKAEPYKLRERAYWLNCLAQVHLANGEIDHACKTASDALEQLMLVESPRVREDFNKLRTQLAPYRTLRSVQDLDEKAHTFFNRNATLS